MSLRTVKNRLKKLEEKHGEQLVMLVFAPHGSTMEQTKNALSGELPEGVNFEDLQVELVDISDSGFSFEIFNSRAALDQWWTELFDSIAKERRTIYDDREKWRG